MTVEDGHRLGEQLRRLRVAAGHTQQELAERAQISVRAISDLERGVHRAPQQETAARIAESLPLSDADRAALATGFGSPRKRTDEGSGAFLLPPVLMPLTSFLGRERELAEVRPLLERTRLLTLTGPGGIGKTRLALELVRTHPLSTVFVDVALVDSAPRLVEAVASALGVMASPGQDLAASLALAIGPRALLLVLDSCEPALEPTAALGHDLLRTCPQLRILATSREPLRVPGEVTWPVPPLDLPESLTPPSPEEVGRAAAVRLFVERAQLTVPDFVLTEKNASVVATCAVDSTASRWQSSSRLHACGL